MRRPWREAWQDALFGTSGFYRDATGPAGHFTTSTHGPLGPVFAEAIVALADRHGCTAIVDLGAGRGELVAALHATRPDLSVTGVDVVARPAGLDHAIDWLESPGGATLPPALAGLHDTLVVANEWLDVVPCQIAEIDEQDVLREVWVGADGTESMGPPVDDLDLSWAQEWWPDRAIGDRLELGRARDVAYRDLLSRVDRGLVLAIDYGHLEHARPAGGTLVGYRAGEIVAPRPDGSCDLTAHVAMDSLAPDKLLTQREALASLGFRGGTHDHEAARRDPAGYLSALARDSAIACLRDRSGLGAFWWALTVR